MAHRLDQLLRPRSVAVVGASARADSMGEWVLKNLTLGGELALANRENESGADGDLTRLQFMAMYKF